MLQIVTEISYQMQTFDDQELTFRAMNASIMKFQWAPDGLQKKNIMMERLPY